MKRVWRREWQHFLSAPANLALLGVLLLLTVAGAVNGVRHVNSERDTVDRALAADARSYAQRIEDLRRAESGQLAAGEFANPRYVHQTILNRGAARPLRPAPAELAVLSSADAQPTPALLNIGIQTRHQDEQPSLDNPGNRLDGTFDLSFVATWLVPLFALILGFDVMARDREQGSAALLATACRLDRVIVRRLVVRFLALLGCVALVSAVAVVVTEQGALASALPVLVVWLLALALVIGFWLALAGIVNVFASNSAQASLILLAAWIAIAMLVPALVGITVNSLAPAPDHLERVLALREVDAELNRRRDEVSEAYYAANPQNSPVRQGDEYEHYFVTELYPRQLEFDRRFNPLADRFEQQRLRQARVMRLASLFSPALSLKLLTEDLAGAAPERRAVFLAAADAFQAEWRAHFDHKLASMRPLEVADLESMPGFAAPVEPWPQRWRRIGLLLTVILVPTLLVSLLARRVLPNSTPW